MRLDVDDQRDPSIASSPRTVSFSPLTRNQLANGRCDALA